MLDHCDACPVRRFGIPCPGRHDAHRPRPEPRMCVLILEKPERWIPEVVRTAVREARVQPTPEMVEAMSPGRRNGENGAAVARALRAWSGDVVRVGFASPSLNLGGAEWSVLYQMEALREAPFRVDGTAVLFEQAHPGMLERARALAPVLFGEDAVRQVAGSVDLLVAWGIPNVMTMLGETDRPRTIMVSQNSSACEWTIRSLREAAQATALVAVSEAAREAFPAEQRSRARIVYNTETEQPVAVPAAEQRAAWGVPPGKKVLGFLGRIAWQKRPEAVVETVHELPDDWVGVLVGAPEDGMAAVTETMKRLSIGHRVFVPGPTMDPTSALAAFDVFLSKSRYEGHPLAWTKAWMVGVPLIATRTAFTAEHPGFVREVGQDATGEQMARAVLDDVADAEGTAARVNRAQQFARNELCFARFRRNWRTLGCSLFGVVDPEVPRVGLLGAAANLAASAATVVGGMVRASKLFVSQEVADRRLSICKACPLYERDKKFACPICSCNMPAKVWEAALECPDKPPRWLAEM